MEENMDVKKFDIVVPYNHEVLVAERKKSKITIGIIFIIATLSFGAFTILSVLGENSVPWAIAIFGAFTAFCLIYALYMFLTIKPRTKDDDKKVTFEFYEVYMKVQQNNGMLSTKTKTLENCLYRNYKNKQYVSKVIETDSKILIKIFTGTYNGVPQYKSHAIPKAIFESDEQLTAFTEFLKEQVEEDKKKK